MGFVDPLIAIIIAIGFLIVLLLGGMPKRKVHVVGRQRMRRHKNLTSTPNRRNFGNKRSRQVTVED